MPGDENLWRSCAVSINKYIVTPWRAVGTVDVFVQSWNPELAASMDQFWQPQRSYHAAQNTTLGRCPVKLQYCDRTMWALNGMKRALGLRRDWAASGGPAGRPMVHATVMVMRHDVIWSAPLPALRADRSVRLWLPFDCHRAACRDGAARASDLYAEPPPPQQQQPADAARRPPASSCTDRKNAQPSNWTMLLAPRSVLGVNCDRPPPSKQHFCGNSVNIDWWWAGDAKLADGFGQTFDSFGEYSRLVKEHLYFHNSAPHHYWGLYFFHKNRLRDKCQLGHAGVSGIDFTLGRFVPPGSLRPTCRMVGWRAYWRPPGAKPAGGMSKAASMAMAGGGDGGAAAASAGGGGAAGGVCNASLIPGYLTMCPGTPAHPVRRICNMQVVENASLTKPFHKLQKRGGDSGGGGGGGNANATSARSRRAGAAGGGGSGGGGGGGGNATATRLRRRSGDSSGNLTNARHRRVQQQMSKAAGTGGASKLLGGGGGGGGGGGSNGGGPKLSPHKPAREALKELSHLREEKLISEAEWERLRGKILDAIVTRASGPSAAAAAPAAGV